MMHYYIIHQMNKTSIITIHYSSFFKDIENKTWKLNLKLAKSFCWGPSKLYWNSQNPNPSVQFK